MIYSGKRTFTSMLIVGLFWVISTAIWITAIVLNGSIPSLSVDTERLLAVIFCIGCIASMATTGAIIGYFLNKFLWNRNLI